MLNDRLAAARLVYDKLQALELAIDEALTSAAELTAAAPRARKRANLSPVVGAEAVALTGEAMAALFAAREKITAAHGAYAQVRDELGIPARMTGDMWKLASRPATETATVETLAPAKAA